MLVTAELNQIDCGILMVAYWILFDDGDGDVVLSPHVLPLYPHNSME